MYDPWRNLLPIDSKEDIQIGNLGNRFLLFPGDGAASGRVEWRRIAICAPARIGPWRRAGPGHPAVAVGAAAERIR
jgi:hypothetical protein